jgi:hypothetical protein
VTYFSTVPTGVVGVGIVDVDRVRRGPLSAGRREGKCRGRCEGFSVEETFSHALRLLPRKPPLFASDEIV